MSYRSLKRVLGEASLERKCLLLFGACLLLLIMASFWWYGRQTDELVYQENRNKGSLLVDRAVITKHWETWESDIGWKPRIKSLTENLGKQEYKVNWIRPDAVKGPYAPQDDFEAEVRQQFLAVEREQDTGPGPFDYRERLLTGANEYQYFQPVYVYKPAGAANSNCTVSCHMLAPGGAGVDMHGTGFAYGPPPAENGLISIAKVTIDNGPAQRSLYWNRAVLISTAIITAFLAVVTSYLIIRYVIVKPLRHLRDTSDAISRGDLALRAEIHTGDEFEELATAFNRMLRHLIAAQEELRQANVNLDAKVDELAQANMRLYELNMLKSDFLATMSHELRTPLNAILGFSDVLGSIDALDEKQKHYVRNIQESGRTLLEMINDILDLAKMESGKMQTRLSDFSIAQVVGAQCDMARPLTEKKNIDLDCDIGADLPPMRQDQARVQQILNNLLSNAIKFTPEGGRITVRVRCDEENFLVLQVIDTGVGIADEDQQVIFEKFRQGRVGVPTGDAMTREYSGSGLGLSIVKELCKLLGGGVSVTSELGKGSTFTVRLPWNYQEQSRHDTPLTEGFDEFGRARFDFLRSSADNL